jgi:hypothetical protein
MHAPTASGLACNMLLVRQCYRKTMHAPTAYGLACNMLLVCQAATA